MTIFSSCGSVRPWDDPPPSFGVTRSSGEMRNDKKREHPFTQNKRKRGHRGQDPTTNPLNISIQYPPTSLGLDLDDCAKLGRVDALKNKRSTSAFEAREISSFVHHKRTRNTKRNQPHFLPVFSTATLKTMQAFYIPLQSRRRCGSAIGQNHLFICCSRVKSPTSVSSRFTKIRTIQFNLCLDLLQQRVLLYRLYVEFKMRHPSWSKNATRTTSSICPKSISRRRCIASYLWFVNETTAVGESQGDSA